MTRCSLYLLVGVAACGGDTLSDHPLAFDSGIRDSAQTATLDAAALAQRCEDLMNMSVHAIDAVAASADRRCTRVEDCITLFTSASCGGGFCNTEPFSDAGAAAVQSAIDLQDSTTCAAYATMHCPPLAMPSCARSSVPSCLNGQCALVFDP